MNTLYSVDNARLSLGLWTFASQPETVLHLPNEMLWLVRYPNFRD